MNKQAKLALLAALAGVVLILAGCPQQTSIGNITRDPGAYANKEVTVVGTVNHSYGVLTEGVYELSDDVALLRLCLWLHLCRASATAFCHLKGRSQSLI